MKASERKVICNIFKFLNQWPFIFYGTSWIQIQIGHSFHYISDQHIQLTPKMECCLSISWPSLASLHDRVSCTGLSEFIHTNHCNGDPFIKHGHKAGKAYLLLILEIDYFPSNSFLRPAAEYTFFKPFWSSEVCILQRTAYLAKNN